MVFREGAPLNLSRLSTPVHSPCGPWLSVSILLPIPPSMHLFRPFRAIRVFLGPSVRQRIGEKVNCRIHFLCPLRRCNNIITVLHYHYITTLLHYYYITTLLHPTNIGHIHFLCQLKPCENCNIIKGILRNLPTLSSSRDRVRLVIWHGQKSIQISFLFSLLPNY